jgi:hypothetical protein
MTVVDRATAKTAAGVIKNETTPNANTATRVGGALEDIVDSVPFPKVIDALLSGDVNNWSPTDFIKVKDGTLRVQTNDSTQRTITGFAAQVHGFRFVITNRGTGNIILSSGNGASSAANQIDSGAGIVFLQPEVGAAELEYDLTSARWKVISFQHMRGFTTPPDIGPTANNGGSHRYADQNHIHRLLVGAGLNWNSGTLEAKGEPAPTHAATLATSNNANVPALTIPLADNTRYDLKVRITGRADTNALVLQELEVCYTRKSGGPPVQSGTTQGSNKNSVGVGTGASFSFTGVADLQVSVQGATGVDINWDVQAWVVAKALPAQPA